MPVDSKSYNTYGHYNLKSKDFKAVWPYINLFLPEHNYRSSFFQKLLTDLQANAVRYTTNTKRNLIYVF